MRYTANYNFSTYEPGDNANLLDAFNANFEKLDGYMMQFASMLTCAQNNIKALQNQYTSLEARVAALESNA